MREFARMPSSGLEDLTDREKTCLRLVQGGFNTKEIARKVGISDLRATKVIHSAMVKLGVSRRQEAARLLAASEEGVSDIPGISQTLPQPPSDSADHRPSEELPLIVRDVRSQFGEVEPKIDQHSRSVGGVRDELTNQQVLIRLVALVALALLGLGVTIYAIGSAVDQVAIVPRNSISR